MDLATAYKILGVGPSSTQKSIRESYKKLIKKWHPDKHDTNENNRRVGEEKSKYINQAYRYLTTHRSWDNRKKSTKSAHRNTSNTKINLQNLLVTTFQVIFIFAGLPFLLFWSHPLHIEYFPFLHNQDIRPELHFDESKIFIATEKFLLTNDREISILENPRMVNILRKPSTLKALMDSLFILYSSADYELIDLDSDGYREMILQIYSDSDQSYQQSLWIMNYSGEFSYSLCEILEDGALIDFQTSEIHQPITAFRGFYFCDTCTISPSLMNLENKSNGLASIQYQFFDEGLTYTRGTRSGNNEILNILKFLKTRGVPSLKEESIDDGTRRAYAETLAGHFYRNYDLNKVRELYYKYYEGTDKHRVWSGIVSKLILEFPVRK